MEGNKVDMFSLLPESLLCVIISFLPFKEAARTCILSKRWLRIWERTRNMEFNELFFVKLGESNEAKEAQKRVFLSFITHFIAHYKDKFVDKFSLKVSDPQSCGDTIELCAAFATQHGVKELRLDFSNPTWDENENLEMYDTLFQLPKHVYRHESLEALKLYSCGFAMLDLCNFKALKDVSLGWIEVDAYALKTLLYTCKKIENLSLKKCNLKHFDMGDQELGLRKLVIDKCLFLGDDFIIFKAPNLVFLKYYGVVGFYEIDVRPYVMQEADIDFAQLMPIYEECGDDICHLLQYLSSVRVLTLCSFTLQAIPSGEEPVRIQCDMNVRHLILKTQMHHFELCGFMFLLNSCAWLEKLTIEIGQGKIFRDYRRPYPISFTRFWKQCFVTPECLRNTLKVVEVKGFRGTMNEVQVCNYLIQGGSVLEEFNINVVKNEDDSSQILERRYANANVLLTVPKASNNLQISIA
ncbi:hypothetical protein VNO77_13059 [Canavalia gladiata]|uniref:FBD domain-containing protein n=1 Tax=Canavalia gladiata TaxID=3824 RepID=A0AAN9M2A4_CANGL